MQYVLQVNFQEIMAYMGDCKWVSWLPVLVVSCSECLSTVHLLQHLQSRVLPSGHNLHQLYHFRLPLASFTQLQNSYSLLHPAVRRE